MSYYPTDPEWYDRPGGRLHPGYSSHRRAHSNTGSRPNIINVHAVADPHVSSRASSSGSRSPSRGRRSSRLYDDLLDEVHGLRKDFRSRSRARSDVGGWREPSPDPRVANWQLYAAEQKLKDREEEEAIRRQIELKQKEAELDRIEGDRRAADIKAKVLRDKERADAEAEERQRRAVMDFQDKERKREEREKALLAEAKEKERRAAEKAKEEKQRAVDEWQRKQREEKAEKDRLKLQFELEEEENKRKKKEEYEAYKRKIEKEEAEEKEKKKKKEKELEDEMHRRMAKFGFQENQIEAMLDPKKAEKLATGFAPGNALALTQPTYIKVHRDHLSMDTLRYYNLPWEYDRVDSNYIIILREMDQRETDILFEHTKRLRKGATQLFIEDRGRREKPEYAFVRKPSRSKSRRGEDRLKLRIW